MTFEVLKEHRYTDIWCGHCPPSPIFLSIYCRASRYFTIQSYVDCEQRRIKKLVTYSLRPLRLAHIHFSRVSSRSLFEHQSPCLSLFLNPPTEPTALVSNSPHTFLSVVTPFPRSDSCCDCWKVLNDTKNSIFDWSIWESESWVNSLFLPHSWVGEIAFSCDVIPSHGSSGSH